MNEVPDNELIAEAEQAPKLMETSGRAVAGAAVIMIVTIFLSRLLGVARESVTVYIFGSDSPEMAAIEAALTIPNLIFFLVAGGALRSGFVPIFTDYLVKQRSRDAWAVFSGFTTFLVFVGGGALLLAMVFAQPLVKLAAPGFSGETLDMAVELTRWMLPVQLFLLLGGLFGGVLNVLGEFWMPAIAPIVYNAAIVTCVALLSRGMGATSFAVGMLIGAFGGSFLLQLPSLFARKCKYWINFAWNHEGIRTVFKLALPIIVGMTANEINGRVNIALASTLSNEAVVALGRAFRVARLPDGIFAMSVGIALLPALSHFGSIKEMERFRETLATALRAIIVATVPSALLLIVLRQPVMSLIYEHGSRVRPEDVKLMATILAVYALGIVPLSLRVVLTRAFYALMETWVPAWIGILEVACCIGMNLLTVKHFGAWGLALGTSTASLLSLTVNYLVFYRRVGPLGAKRMLRGFLQTCLAGLGMAVIAAMSYTFLEALLPHNMIGMGLALLVALGLSGTAYVVFCKGLGVEEISLVLGGLARRFKPKQATPQG